MIHFLKTKAYDIGLGVIAVLLMTLLILYLVLAMISITSGISQTISIGHEDVQRTKFDLGAAAALNLN
ncbi:MAG: hypothetical protein AAB691_03315 [Patescibacteria group bacterium]